MPAVLSALPDGQCASLDDLIVGSLRTLTTDFEKYVEMIEQVIDIERAESKMEFLVMPSFDEALKVSSLAFSINARCYRTDY